MDIHNLISFGGIFVLLFLAWILSSDKKNMNWRVIGWGVGIQLLVAVFIFIMPIGIKLFQFLNGAVIEVLNSASAGSEFVFGRLALPPGAVNAAGEKSIGFILAFQAFPTIIFFSALIAILYFFNIMPLLIRGFAIVFTKLMKISGAESLVSSSNIFVGVESALIVKPHLKEMTRSELCTILTAGMATVASNILALYVFSLRGQFPSIAGHLISASLLSAPAALVMSKIILPESDVPKTLNQNVKPHYEKENNLFEAIINGAQAGVKMVVGIVALLIAVMGLVALIDLILGAVGTKMNFWFGCQMDYSLVGLLSYVFYPFALILGVPLRDASLVSHILAERLILTEVAAYQSLAGAIARDALHHPRSAFVLAYALCGFAHLASMSIFVGGISALVPDKTKDIAQVAPRALLAATLACLLTACVAGTFFMAKESILLGG